MNKSLYQLFRRSGYGRFGKRSPWFLVASLVALLGASALGAQPPSLLPATRDEIEALQLEKASRTPVQRKLDSQLLFGSRQRAGRPIAVRAPRVRARMRERADGQVLVDIRANATPALLDQIERLGGRVINSHPRANAIRALVPWAALELLAAEANVRRIRPADEAITNAGSVTSQGDITHRAAEARTAFGAAGDGIKIAVLSDGVSFLGSSQVAGELPNVTVLPGQSGGGSEGTAMLEIVHDLVPEAELFFATGLGSQAAFAQNIRDLYALGCRVFVDDLTYYAEPPFQDGPIALAVNEVSAGGALFFSSAANSGNKNDGTSGTWEGDFVDGGAATVGRGGRLHNFGGSAFNTVLPGGTFGRIDFFWADPLGASTNDYDVYLLDASGSVVASSSNVQDGNDDPYEAIPTLNVGERVVIVKFSGAARHLHLSTGRSVLTFSTPGSTRGHNASGASNAFSVAAAWVRSPAVPFVGGAVNPVETFSSDGPRRMFFHPNGQPITPGNFSANGGMVLQKPDFTAADGVATSVPSFSSFFGTSASAPHAAAIAALLWSYNPALTPEQIRVALTSTALDIEAPGVDRDSGAGIIMARQAIEAVPPPLPRLVFHSAVFTNDNGNGTVDAGDCGDIFLALRNRISTNGAPATGVFATLSSATLGVVVDPSPRAFPDVPAGGRCTNALAFRFGTTPDYVCANPADFVLSVTTSNAGNFSLPFQIAATRPGVGSAVTFASTNAPLPVPDASSVESIVRVSGVTLPIAKVTVSFHLTHTYDSDLVVSLVAPDGTTVDLTSNNGGSTQGYGAHCNARTAFDDAATTNITDAPAPFVGVYRPEQPLSLFAGKTGSAANGLWKLRLRDEVEYDEGTLQCWTLQVTSIACSQGAGLCLLPPRIVTPPAPLTVTNGDTARFRVQAQGTDPLFFQWFFNGTNRLVNATNVELVLNDAALAQEGRYSVLVSNFFGSVFSADAALTVIAPPRILQPPTDMIVTNGTSAAFTAVAEGTRPLLYQWYFNATNRLAGATNSVLLLSNVSPALAGRYSVSVSNIYGVIMGPAANLIVGLPPFIAQQPASVTVSNADNVTLSVVAGGTEPLRYQWFFKETIALPDATNAALTLTAVTTNQAGAYSVTVTNAFGRVASREAALTVIPQRRNEPPTVALTSPTNGAAFDASGGAVVVSASAGDPEGLLTRLELFANGVSLGRGTNGSLRFEWLDPLVREHSVWAVATDNEGLSATSTVARITVTSLTNPAALLIATGAVWKYLDTGVDQGTAWRAPEFDDRAWSSGPAELGYGDAQEGFPEATVVSFGTNANNKIPTTYFRRAFTLTDAESFTGLRVRLQRDDGAAVYLNGVEILRDNLPAGTVMFSTLASAAVVGVVELFWAETNFSLSGLGLLRNGANVLAVEVHQFSTTNNPDLSFDLELRGERNLTPRIVIQPTPRTLFSGTTGRFEVEASGSTPLSYQWFFNGTNRLAGGTNAVLLLPFLKTNQAGSYHAVASNPFGAVTSVTARLTVVPSLTNLAPSVVLISPTNGATFAVNGDAILIAADVSDPDDGIANVAFFADGVELARVTAGVWNFKWLDPRPGSHRVWAVATDDRGVAETSRVVTVTADLTTDTALLLIPTGTVWNYLDTGVDQGTAWRAVDFDDSAWRSGVAELGYGDGADGRPEATVIRFGPNATNKYPTAYFRRRFWLTDSASFGDLRLRLLRDDGAAVYLNGAEVLRNNLPSGALNYTNFAITAVNGEDETNWVSATIGSLPLVSGWNAIAVEVHQASSNSPDLSFDFELTGTRRFLPLVAGPPQSLSVTSGLSAVFEVRTDGPGPLSFQWYFNQTNALPGATNSTLTLDSVTAGQAGAYHVEIANPHGIVATDPATLRVIVPVFNQPPIVALTSPRDGDVSGFGDTIVFLANATDPDGSLARVEYFAGTNRLAETTDSPFRFDWADAPMGTQEVYAVVTDNFGLAATSSVARVLVTAPFRSSVMLVATGSVWRYLDTGVDAGTNWHAPNFDDQSWPSGPAELGYGDLAEGRPEATVIRFGNEETNKHPAYYFRRTFTVLNPGVFTQLVVRLLRDDGAVVYLNDEEVMRSNLPEGPIRFGTLALATVSQDEEFRFFTHEVDPARLRRGTNVVAVEVHQVSPASTDVSFDLELTGTQINAPIILAPPRDVTVTNGGTAVLTVAAVGAPLIRYQWYFNDTTRLAGETNAILRLTDVTTNQSGRYSVLVNNPGGVTVSDAARLTVVVPVTNRPPEVAFVTPRNGDTFIENSNITLVATASDPDGTIARVIFEDIDADRVLSEVSASPYAFEWIGASLGTHKIRVRAIDDQGATSLSSAVTISVVPAPLPPGTPVTLLRTGSVWKYLDTGTNLGTAWRATDFADTAWSEGAAELGYGDGKDGRPERTLIGFGGNPSNRVVTTYFRRALVLTNALALTELRLRLLRDDGAAVYLNGVEVFRDNLPAGEVTFDMLASADITGSDETNFVDAAVSPAVLVTGTNILAVEIHQVSRTNDDVSFDLELTGTLRNAPTVLIPPRDQETLVGGRAEFRVVAFGLGPLVYQWFFNGLTPIPGATNATLIVTNTQPIDEGSYSVVVTNLAGMAESAAAILRVLRPPVITGQPRNQTVLAGTSVQFSVEAGGSPPFRYQWYFNTNTPIPHATNATLEIAAVGMTDSGFYHVVMANGAGSATSQIVALRVLERNFILHIALRPNGTNVIFTTLAGLRYSLEYKPELSSTNGWTIVPGASKLLGTGAPMQVTDPLASPVSPGRIYRVRIE